MLNKLKETMKLTKTDKKILLQALYNFEQTIFNWSNDYLEDQNKEYNCNILNALDKITTKIINNKN